MGQPEKGRKTGITLLALFCRDPVPNLMEKV
jgi:hypothetical protein